MFFVWEIVIRFLIRVLSTCVQRAQAVPLDRRARAIRGEMPGYVAVFAFGIIGLAWIERIWRRHRSCETVWI